MEYIYFDKKPLVREALTDDGTLPFFREEKDGDGSTSLIIDAPESELVEIVFNHSVSQQFLLDKLGIKGSTNLQFGVTDPFTDRTSRPGDIDIIATDCQNPKETKVFECKRLKIKKSGGDDINKLSGLKKGLTQVQGLHDLGFHQTILCILAATDGRDQQDNNTVTRNMNDQLRRKIRNTVAGLNVRDGVGIVFIECVQPTNRSFEEMSGIGLSWLKKPKPQTQTHDLTMMIEKFFECDDATSD